MAANKGDRLFSTCIQGDERNPPSAPTMKGMKNKKKNNRNFMTFVFFMVNPCGFALFTARNEAIRERQVPLQSDYRCNSQPRAAPTVVAQL